MGKWIGILVLLLPIFAFAQQRVPVQDGDTVRVTVSSMEMNRFAAGGKGRLVKAWVVNGEFDMEADKEQGEIFIKPRSMQTFSFFVRDDMGNTFTVVAEPMKVPSQTVIFQGKATVLGSRDLDRFKGDPILERLAKLNTAMSNRKPIRGYQRYRHEVDRTKPWPDVELRLVTTYESSLIIGEIYELRNTSNGILEFKEEDFMNFGNGVLAVGMEYLSVPAGMRTFVYITRKAGG